MEEVPTIANGFGVVTDFFGGKEVELEAGGFLGMDNGFCWKDGGSWDWETNAENVKYALQLPLTVLDLPLSNLNGLR
jgi:hypothetical protein